MAHTYPEVDKRGWIYQPNFVRKRHKYRSPRESEKINQEIYQYYYDVRRVDAMQDEMVEQYSSDITLFEDGGSVDGVTIDWGDDATPVIYDAEIMALEDLKILMDSLNERVRDLEGR